MGTIKNPEKVSLVYTYEERNENILSKCKPLFVYNQIEHEATNGVNEYVPTDYYIGWISVNNKCLSSNKGLNNEPTLEDCNIQDQTQQWYLPNFNDETKEKGNIYLVNVFDSSLCLDFNVKSNKSELSLCAYSKKVEITSNSIKINNI